MNISIQYNTAPSICPEVSTSTDTATTPNNRPKTRKDDDMQCRYDHIPREILAELRQLNATMRRLDGSLIAEVPKGLPGVVANLARIYEEVESGMIMPESWNIKSDAVEHLVVKWRSVGKDGKPGSKYSTTAIPYYRHGTNYTPKFSNRRMGNHRSVLGNIGLGAHIVVFGHDKTESNKVLEECVELVQPNRIPQDWRSLVTHGTMPTNYNQLVFRAVSIHFFKAGWKKGESLKLADWSKNLRWQE